MANDVCLCKQEKAEYTNKVTRSCKSKDRQCNGQKIKDKKTINDPRRIEQHERFQGLHCRSPMSQFVIFFLDWRLKSASGDFFGAYISLCKFIDNHCVP